MSNLEQCPACFATAAGRLRRAFTLIELLVVIAIIAILAAMLLSALSTAKEKGNTIDCINRLKQLGLAMQLYGDEHRQMLPMAHQEIGWGVSNQCTVCKEQVPAWSYPLAPYFQTTNLLKCPSLSRHLSQSPFSYFMGSRAAFLQSGYKHASVSFGQIQYPSAYILSGDANASFKQTDADPDNYTQNTLFARKSPVHNAKLNVLFADWHAKTYAKFNRAEMTYSYTNSAADYDDYY